MRWQLKVSLSWDRLENSIPSEIKEKAMFLFKEMDKLIPYAGVHMCMRRPLNKGVSSEMGLRTSPLAASVAMVPEE